jgi:hypothetical protein
MTSMSTVDTVSTVIAVIVLIATITPAVTSAQPRAQRIAILRQNVPLQPQQDSKPNVHTVNPGKGTSCIGRAGTKYSHGTVVDVCLTRDGPCSLSVVAPSYRCSNGVWQCVDSVRFKCPRPISPRLKS